MGRSQVLKLSEVKQVFRLVGAVRELRHDQEAQETLIVDRLCEIIGAPVGWAVGFEDFRRAQDTRIVRFNPGTVADENWLEYLAWWGQISDVEDDWMLREAIGRDGLFDAERRSGLFTMEEYSKCKAYSFLGIPLNIRDSLALWFRYPGSDDVRGYAFQRVDEDSEFTKKQVRLGRLFAEELRNLYTEGKLEPPPVYAKLPPRLRALAPLLLSGMGQKQIASRTGLSYATVRSYVKELYAILGVGSRAELIAKLRNPA